LGNKTLDREWGGGNNKSKKLIKVQKFWINRLEIWDGGCKKKKRVAA